MAQHGFQVTAFDITEEMIAEGKRRFGEVSNLTLAVADICDFSFNEYCFDFSFITSQDLHLLPTVDDVAKALSCIHAHLREGGCLVLELQIGSDESAHYPTQTFHPRAPRYQDKKIWKESECRYDGQTKQFHITQEIYVEDAQGVEHFNYSVCLQYFERNALLAVAEKAGFGIAHEFCDRVRTPWQEGDSTWILELTK